MGLFGDLLTFAAGELANAFLDSNNNNNNNNNNLYLRGLNDEGDKELFNKLMEKWDNFFSNLEISETINFIETDQIFRVRGISIRIENDPLRRMQLEEKGDKISTIHLCKNGEKEFYYGNYDNGSERNDNGFYGVKDPSFYYKFIKNDTTFSLCVNWLGSYSEDYAKAHYRYGLFICMEADSCKIHINKKCECIIEDNNINDISFKNVMKVLGFNELGEKIISVNKKLEDIQINKRRQVQEQQQAIEEAKREKERRKSEILKEKMKIEKKKETEAILSKLDEL